MAKQAPRRVPPVRIKEKNKILISDTSSENIENTVFPDSDYLKRSFKGFYSRGQGTSASDWGSKYDDLTVPIKLPERNSLSVDLVPSDLVFKLEEYRKDGSIFTAFFWTLLGSIISILYDLFTTNPFTLSINSISLLVILSIFLIANGILSIIFTLRANKKIKEIKNSINS